MQQSNNKDYNTSEARENFTDLLNQAAYAKDRIMITRRNKPLAYIVPIEDIELLEQIEDAYDIKTSKKAKKEAQTKGFIDWQTLKEDLGL